MDSGAGGSESEEQGEVPSCPGSRRARLASSARSVRRRQFQLRGVSCCSGLRAEPRTRERVTVPASVWAQAASGARGDRRRLVLHGPARRSGCAADAQPTSRSCGRSVHAALPRAGAHTRAASRFHNVQRIGKLSAGGFHVGHEV